MDHGYLDFELLLNLTKNHAIFVTRSKKKLFFRRVYSHPLDNFLGWICDQTIRSSGPNSQRRYPDKLRRIRYRDAERSKTGTILSNDFTLPAFAETELYHHCWRIVLFFKRIKQHFRIKTFYGTSFNAVKTKIWIAISVYVLVAIIRKRLSIERDPYTIKQILSECLFEQDSLSQVLAETGIAIPEGRTRNQFGILRLMIGQY